MTSMKDLLDLLNMRVSYLNDGGVRVDGVLEEVWSNGWQTRVTVYHGSDPARRRDGEVYRRNFAFRPSQDFRLFDSRLDMVGT